VIDPITIGPDPGRVEIRYSATGPAIPERIVLEYMLEGADRSWIQSSPDRVVAYGQLRPGTYTFRVRATNADGIASRSDAALRIRVTPAWYQSKWFLALLLLLVAAGGAAVVHAVQQARARRETERLQARYDATLSERTRLARELHDTLLQGFTGITLQLQALQRMITTSPRNAAISLSGVLSTADATLRDARQMVWDMRAPELDHHDLAEALEIAARQAIADTGTRLDFSVLGTARRLDIGVETTALRIGREAIVNAVKHAAARVITVSVHFASTQLMLIVRDDGRGCDDAMVERAVEGGHWGIRSMRERAARAGGTLEIAGQVGAGTTITLVVPLRGAQLPPSAS
jgi:signal transduction histidine kinase